MKKLFLPLICVLLFCLCGCNPDNYIPLYVENFPNVVHQNEEIPFAAGLTLFNAGDWIISLEGLPKDVVVEKGERSEEHTTEKKYCVKVDEEGSDIKVRFSYDTPGKRTIKVNAFQINGQEIVDDYRQQKYFTYTITVTE